MTEFEALLSRYDYSLSPEMVALEPASPRDSSKVLIYDRKTFEVKIDVFRNIAKYLPKNALLVFNDTKVIPARIPAYLATGRKVGLLCTKFEGPEISALCERFLPAGEILSFTKDISGKVIGKTGSEYAIRLNGVESIRSLLLRLGTTPLPPYLKHSPLSEQERRKKYQTTFAKHEGSIAAPTASLHFTPRVFTSLVKAGIETAHVTLHVNLGTFMPLTEEAMQKKELHEEHFEIPQVTLRKIRQARKSERPIIAVGTTALRAIESAFAGNRNSTRLFIQEGYDFKAITGLITNFHVPRSSLMMLVAALIDREKLLELYTFAAKNNFRFFSFGDAMLIL